MKILRSLLAGAILAATAASGALAVDSIRVGKSVGNPLAFTPVDIGIAKGIFAEHDLEISEIQIYGGEAKLQQALIANSTDFALGSGPGMGFIARGVDAMTVAAVAGAPLSMGLISAGFSDPEELKGKRIGVSTPSSLTYFLSREFSRQMGWGSEGVIPVPVGGLAAQVAALRAGQTDAFIMSSSAGYHLEKEGDAQVVLEFGNLIDDFHTHVIFATGDVVRNRPDVVRRFLAAWQDTIEFMFENKEETVALARQVTGLPEDVAMREYDEVMPMMSRDLRFNEASLNAVADAIVEMGVAPELPDMSTLYTEEFLPAATN